MFFAAFKPTADNTDQQIKVIPAALQPSGRVRYHTTGKKVARQQSLAARKLGWVLIEAANEVAAREIARKSALLVRPTYTHGGTDAPRLAAMQAEVTPR